MTHPMKTRDYGGQPPPIRRPESANLADILERVLDKGIVIAGDIQVNLLDIELLTIKLRLIVTSVDRAKEIGLDWWEHDPTLSSRGAGMAEENRLLRERIAALEAGQEREPPSLDRREQQEREEREERRQRGEQQERREREERRERRAAGSRERAGEERRD